VLDDAVGRNVDYAALTKVGGRSRLSRSRLADVGLGNPIKDKWHKHSALNITTTDPSAVHHDSILVVIHYWLRQQGDRLETSFDYPAALSATLTNLPSNR
jgi:hypothetical protein